MKAHEGLWDGLRKLILLVRGKAENVLMEPDRRIVEAPLFVGAVGPGDLDFAVKAHLTTAQRTCC